MISIIYLLNVKVKMIKILKGKIKTHVLENGIENQVNEKDITKFK
jgi:hypothetical protein